MSQDPGALGISYPIPHAEKEGAMLPTSVTWSLKKKRIEISKKREFSCSRFCERVKTREEEKIRVAGSGA